MTGQALAGTAKGPLDGLPGIRPLNRPQLNKAFRSISVHTPSPHSSSVLPHVMLWSGAESLLGPGAAYLTDLKTSSATYRDTY